MTAFKTLVAVTLLSPAIALANGYSVPNVNARDPGAAGALVAAQRDAAAAWQNPAALSKLEGLELSFSASLLVNSTTWKEAGRSQSTDFALAPPPSLWAGYGTELAATSNGIRTAGSVPNTRSRTMIAPVPPSRISNARLGPSAPPWSWISGSIPVR